MHVILPKLSGISTLKLPESPVPHLLLCNEPPTDQEVALTRSVIQKAEMEEEKVRAKMLLRSSNRGVGLWGATATAKRKLVQTARFIEQHREVVSPLRRLPNEILQEIFVRFNDPRSSARLSWTNTSKVPWVLAQVCRSWRSTALSVSELWSRLPTVSLSNSDPGSKDQMELERLEELLVCSHSAPLDIYISALYFQGRTHALIDLLFRHCERWQAVTIIIHSSFLPRLSKVKGRLSKLESLAFNVNSYAEGLPPIDIFEDAAQLRSVDIHGAFPAELILPFGQLQHCKDSLRPKNSITHLATSAHSLETLSIIEFCESTEPLPVPNLALTLPSLKNLQVKICCSPPHVFKHLAVPSIRELTIVTNTNGDCILQTIINMINNSPMHTCPLKTLRIRTHEIQTHEILQGELTALLRLTPHLTSLDMPIPPTHDINMLATQSSLVPHLETCDFSIANMAKSSMNTKLALRVGGARCEPRLRGGSPGSTSPFTSAGPSSSSISFPDPTAQPQPRRLDKLMLHYNCHWVFRQKATLEGWKSSDASENLNRFKDLLHNGLPALDSCLPKLVRNGSGKLDKKRLENEKDILNTIEALDPIVPEDIFTSEIHISLRNMTECPSLLDDTSQLSTLILTQTKRILDKWAREPGYQRCLEKCRWMMSGEFGLIYISQDAPIRASPEALHSFLYEKPDPLAHHVAYLPNFIVGL